LIFEPFMGGGIITAMAAIALTEFGQWQTLSVVVVIFCFWLWLGFHLGQPRHATQRKHRQNTLLGKLATWSQD
ncbi:MAG: hypothetical protein WAQ22_02510, partial [Candidatus Saccharimonas sp.]